MGSWLGTLLRVILKHTPVQQEAHRAAPLPQAGLGSRDQHCAVATPSSRSEVISCLLM